MKTPPVLRGIFNRFLDVVTQVVCSFFSPPQDIKILCFSSHHLRFISDLENEILEEKIKKTAVALHIEPSQGDY